MAIFSWLVSYAPVLLNLFHIGPDGCTPYKRLKGKSWRIPLAAFGEKVEFKTKPESKSNPTWQEGIFLGIKEASTEKIVGTKDGTYAVGSIQRKPTGEQFDAEMIQAIKGTPAKSTR